MSRPNPLFLTGAFVVFIAVFGGFSILQGALYLDTHEGDTYHHLDILFRMTDGARPHQDFMTPLGLFAFLPVLVFMKIGFSVGTAFLWAQLAVALLLLPLIVYVATTRLSTLLAYGFGFVVLLFVLALTYGGSGAGVSISMHYNRWAWAVAFVLLALALLPPLARRRPLFDGVLMGALAAALLLLKITFFVSFVPVVAIALLLRRDFRTLAACLAGCLVVLAAVTLAYGVGHWAGYWADLSTVSAGQLRPFVGVPFDQITAGPPYLAGTVIAILSVLLLRRSGLQREGTVLLLLVPAFLYVTYQNFGNDPKWLAFIPILLLTLLKGRETSETRPASSGPSLYLSIAAVALISPSLVNLALSPISHAAIRSAQFLPMIPSKDGSVDIYVRRDRAHTMTAEVHLDETSRIWARYSEDAGRADPVTLGGVEFAHCELYAGSHAFFVEITSDLSAADLLPGSQLFTTDILTAFWLFGPFEPLQGGAPWYYGGLSGIENADYVLVPKCPFLASHRRIMVDEIKVANIPLSLVRDNELYALFAIDRQ